MPTPKQQQSPIPQQPAQPSVPQWWQWASEVYRDGIAHAFLLHGNVRDYVDAGYVPLQRFLAAALSRQADLIVQIDPAQGLDFPIPAQRDLLAKLLALPSAPQIPLVQGLRQANGQAQRSPALLSLRDVSVLLDWLLTEPLTMPDRAPLPTARGAKLPAAPRVRVAVLVDFGEFLLPDSELTRTDPAILTRFIKWAQSLQVGQEHILIMTAESLSAIHSELRRASARWEAIEVPLPGLEARERFINHTLGQLRTTDGAAAMRFGADLTPRQVAQMTGGLSLLQIEDVLFRGAGAGTLTRALVAERKQAIIRQEFADVLQISDARFDLGSVGGYDYLKTWLGQRVITPWQAGQLRVGGLLLSGPPGTGKTQLAEALAGSAAVPYVVFRLSKILGQYVGNSERNLDRALQALMSLAPVLVFIDELDQTVRRGEGETTSGVDNRVFARLLEWLEDPARRGKILVVAASNRPDLLDAALRSRFDRTVPVLPPVDADERAAVFQAQARAQGLDLLITPEAVVHAEGWTGRNIRDFMEVVGELMHDGLDGAAALAEARTLYVPAVRDVQQMTALALAEMTDLRLVPPAWREHVQTAQAKAQLAAEAKAEPTLTRRPRKRLL